MASLKLDRRLILHLTVRDPQIKFAEPHNTWRCADGESLFFMRSTLWGPVKQGHSVQEVNQLYDEISQIRQEMLRRALENPIVSDAPDAPLNVDWLNAKERQRANLVRALVEASEPTGESFCILVDRDGVATSGKHRFDYSPSMYIEVLNIKAQEDLAHLNNKLWTGLDPEELAALAEGWRQFGRNPIEEGWSWYGDWETFSTQQADLRRLFDQWTGKNWDPEATELMARKLRDTEIVLTDQFQWAERHWGRDRQFWSDEEIMRLDRWTNLARPNAWPEGSSTEYRFVPEEAQVLHGLWSLIFWELSHDIMGQAVPGQCPECSKHLPVEQGRHRDRMCEECKKRRVREQKSRWARKNRGIT